MAYNSSWTGNQVGSGSNAMWRQWTRLQGHVQHSGALQFGPCGSAPLLHAGPAGAQLSKIASALAESPRFLILDFRQATLAVRCPAQVLVAVRHGNCLPNRHSVSCRPSKSSLQAGAGSGRHRRPLLCHPAQQAAPHGHPGTHWAGSSRALLLVRKLGADEKTIAHVCLCAISELRAQ